MTMHVLPLILAIAMPAMGFELLWWKVQLEEKHYQEMPLQKIITWLWISAFTAGSAILSFAWLYLIRHNPEWFASRLNTQHGCQLRSKQRSPSLF
jgi:hypothetical protein